MMSCARWTLLVLLVFACLGDGSGDDWAGVVAQCGCFLALVLSLSTKKGSPRQLYTIPGLLPLAVLAGFFLFQLLPLPPFVIEFLSPATYRLYGETIWVVIPGSWMPLSLVPKATLGGFFLFSSCIAVFIATIQLVPTLEQSKRTLFFLSAGAGLFSLFGMIRFLFWPHPMAGSVDGTLLQAATPAFLGGDSSDYPALMAMLLPAIVGAFLALNPRASYFGFPEQRIGRWTLAPQHLRTIAGLAALPVVGFLLVSSQVWTVLITLGGLLLFAALVRLRGRARNRGGILAGIAIFFLVGVVFLRWGGGLDTLGSEGRQHQIVRGAEWEDGLEIFRRFPVAGTGYGTAPILSEKPGAGTGGKRPSVVGQSFLGRQLAEGGFLGAMLSVWFLSLVIRQCLQTWFRRKSRTSIYLFPGLVAGVIILMAHCFTGKFQHPLPLGVYFSLLLGLMVSVSHARSRSHESDSELAPLAVRTQRRVLAVGFGLGLALIALHGGWTVAAISADRAMVVAAGEGEQAVNQSSLDAAQFSARFDPLDFRYRLALGDVALALGDKPLALEYLSAALKLHPLSSLTLQNAGMVLNTLGEEGRAEALLRAAAEYHPGTVKHQRDYALWLCSRSRYEDSFPYLQRSFELEPERAGELLSLMSACGLEDEQMQLALSDSPSAWVGYGDFLLNRGAEKEAEASYVVSLRFAADSTGSVSLPFWRLYDFYSKRNRPEEALEVVLLGTQTFPEDPRLRLAAGSLYQQLGISYRAIEEYRKTLLLDPANELARVGLKELTNGH